MSDPFVFDHKRLFNEPTMEQHGSHMIIKNVHKPEKTKYLTIDTRFRDQYDTSLLANYNITLPERVNSVKSMKAVSLEMPLSYHNVSDSFGNNSFQITNTTLTETYVYSLGNQNIATTDLGSTIQGHLNAVTTPAWVKNVDVAYSSINGKFTITNNTTNNIDIIFDNVDCAKIPSTTTVKGGLSDRESLMSKLGWLLGFRKSSYSLTTSGTTKAITGEAIADASGVPYFYLIVDEFKNGNPHSFLGVSRTSQLSSQQILARFSVDTSSFNVGISGASLPQTMTVGHNDNMVSDTRTYGELVDIQKMNVRIVDQFGRIINLNGLDFSFCLELIHE